MTIAGHHVSFHRRCPICCTPNGHGTGADCVSSATVRRLMRHHRVTVREIATTYNLPMTRVLHVRRHGGPWDWPLMIEKLSKRGGAPQKA